MRKFKRYSAVFVLILVATVMTTLISVGASGTITKAEANADKVTLGGSKQRIQTVLGEIDGADMGVTLPHEHILVDFAPNPGAPAKYTYDEVSDKLLPLLKDLYEAGGRTLVDCAPDSLGRDMGLLQRISRESGINIIAATGTYKELLPYAKTETPEQMAARWIDEARNGVDGVKPGFIKIAIAGDAPLTDVERNAIKAAMLTSSETGLVIACHSPGPQGMLGAMDIMLESKFDMERLIWIHADLTWYSGPEGEAAVQLAKERGLWIEIDHINTGWGQTFDAQSELIKKLWYPGMRMLISQDAGCYSVGDPDNPLFPFTPLLTDFLQMLPEEMHSELTVKNPAEAFRIR